MTEPRLRRLRWIAWSLRHDLRPLALASVARSCPGSPPELPVRPDRIPGDLALRPSDLRQMTAARPGIEEAAAIEEEATRRGVEILTPEDHPWLRRLWTELADPPAVLYVRGRLHDPAAPSLAIVGARYASDAGLSLARSLARDLAMAGMTIVSGLALGIDGAAHRGALEAGGRTIAVLAGGIDRPTPPSHARLGEAIALSGALVSEFPLGVEPRPLHFPRRNRILAALGGMIVVVEGRGRSGARSTVDHALAIGRDVGAVPRDPVGEGSILPNALLRSGAILVTSAADIIERFGVPAPGGLSADDGGCDAETAAEGLDARILGALASGPRSLDSLCGRLACSAQEILPSLGRLELSGRVRRLHGMSYAKAGRGA
ncbi:MAG: DNA-protecting protein DprA [Candidatus Eisenbacteria bacterium]|nr:DNA-protecting protein DprA [Candidatus Eisenbacteria bacterium]